MFCSVSHAQTTAVMTSPAFTSVRAQCGTVATVSGRCISMADGPKRQSFENASPGTEHSLKNCGLTARHVEGKPAQPPLMLAIEVADDTLSASCCRKDYCKENSESKVGQEGDTLLGHEEPSVHREPPTYGKPSALQKPGKKNDFCIIDIEGSSNKSPLLLAEENRGSTANETISAIEGDSAFISQLNEHGFASDIFSEVLQTLNPQKVYSRYVVQHDDTLKKFAAKVLCNGAAGTISADALDYISQAKGAAGIISAMVAIGIVDGLYSCGKHLHEHRQQPDNVLRILGYGTYKCIRPVMNLLPETFCQCIRKAYIYGSLSGASATLLADFLSHLSKFAMTSSAASFITGYACPILLLVLTSAGGVSGIICAYENYKKNTDCQLLSPTDS
ncbi:hypothetical protein J7438_11640 [Thalassotalea sp. G20_0]|uniref:hypothetical protein n=1 Tax=Thalassotalea sp. G20_0 TaxID=2821093 RepID=UPI001ADB4838|nr:hypothetical protein [Thalassotalea sp. G20_0]MBO9494740.1 hypothetical protein [Thalassotalea sp. G20_0]